MIFSEQLKFSDNQTLAVAAGTVNSTNVVDTGAPGTVFGAAAPLKRNVGPGEDADILIQLTADLTSAGAATLQFQIETADDAAFAVNAAVVAESRVYTLAESVAGLQFGVDSLPEDMQRFIRVNYVIGAFAGTGGTVTAGIVHGVQHADTNY